MKKVLVYNLVAIVVLSVAGLFWCRHHSRQAAERIVRESELREFQFWKEQLVPLYEEMGVEHAPNPQTREELFGPMIRSMKPAESEGEDRRPGAGSGTGPNDRW